MQLIRIPFKYLPEFQFVNSHEVQPLNIRIGEELFPVSHIDYMEFYVEHAWAPSLHKLPAKLKLFNELKNSRTV